VVVDFMMILLAKLFGRSDYPLPQSICIGSTTKYVLTVRLDTKHR